MSLDSGAKTATAWEEEERGEEWNSTQRLRRSRRIADKARAQ